MRWADGARSAVTPDEVDRSLPTPSHQPRPEDRADDLGGNGMFLTANGSIDGGMTTNRSSSTHSGAYSRRENTSACAT